MGCEQTVDSILRELNFVSNEKKRENCKSFDGWFGHLSSDGGRAGVMLLL